MEFLICIQKGSFLLPRVMWAKIRGAPELQLHVRALFGRVCIMWYFKGLAKTASPDGKTTWTWDLFCRQLK